MDLVFALSFTNKIALLKRWENIKQFYSHNFCSKIHKLSFPKNYSFTNANGRPLRVVLVRKKEDISFVFSFKIQTKLFILSET